MKPRLVDLSDITSPAATCPDHKAVMTPENSDRQFVWFYCQSAGCQRVVVARWEDCKGKE